MSDVFSVLLNATVLVWLTILSVRRASCSCHEKWDDQIAINKDQQVINREQIRINNAQIKLNEGALARLGVRDPNG